MSTQKMLLFCYMVPSLIKSPVCVVQSQFTLDIKHLCNFLFLDEVETTRKCVRCRCTLYTVVVAHFLEVS